MVITTFGGGGGGFMVVVVMFMGLGWLLVSSWLVVQLVVVGVVAVAIGTVQFKSDLLFRDFGISGTLPFALVTQSPHKCGGGSGGGSGGGGGGGDVHGAGVVIGG
jgi:hypothetical protein